MRIDKDKSYLLYGDYTTASSDTVRQISQYSRSLNGVKGHYETDIQGRKVEVTGFAAHDTLRQMVENSPPTAPPARSSCVTAICTSTASRWWC